MTILFYMLTCVIFKTVYLSIPIQDNETPFVKPRVDNSYIFFRIFSSLTEPIDWKIFLRWSGGRCTCIFCKNVFFPVLEKNNVRL